MDITKRLINTCEKREITVSLVESVTGGRVAAMMTSVPGASKVLMESIIAYSAGSKHRNFRINKKELRENECVSPEICKKLALGSLRANDTDIAAAVVGFAGPAAPERKKGLIYISVATNNKITSIQLNLRGSREKIMEKAAARVIKEISLLAQEIK